MTQAKAVADSSVLIVLAKVNRLVLLRNLYGTIPIGPAAHHEVLEQGRRPAAPGVTLLEEAVNDGWLRVAKLTGSESHLARKLRSNDRLGAGEIEAISLAARRGLRLLVDDKEARHAAETRGVEFIGTLGVLIEALRRRNLRPVEFEALVEELTAILWLSPRVVATALRLAKEQR